MVVFGNPRQKKSVRGGRHALLSKQLALAFIHPQGRSSTTSRASTSFSPSPNITSSHTMTDAGPSDRLTPQFSSAELDRINAELDGKSPQEVLRWAIDHVQGLFQTTAFGL